VSKNTCAFEEPVRHASIDGRWTADLTAHVDGCAVCDEVRTIACLLQTPQSPAPVTTDPRLIWVSARHARRLRAEAQISQIVTAAQIAACAVVVAALASFASWPDAWPTFSFDGGDRTVLYAVAGVVMVGAVALSQWRSRDVI
jgi:hypothetical protein